MICGVAQVFPAEIDEGKELEEVAVVGSRLPTDTIGVDSVDLDELIPQCPLAHAPRSMTGMVVSQSGNVSALLQVRVRGAEADHLKVRLNGFPLNTGSEDLNFATISPVAISRIEAIREPRSTVWGNHALAGVINLDVSPKSIDRVYVDAGSHNTRTIGADFGKKFADTAFSLPAAHRTSEGTNASYHGAERDGFRQNSAHAGYEHELRHIAAIGFVRTTSTVAEYDPIPLDGDKVTATDKLLVAQRVAWTISDEFSMSLNASQTVSYLRNFGEHIETNSWRGKLSRVAIEGSRNLTANQELNVVLDYAIEDFKQRGNVSFAATRTTVNQ